MCPSPIQHSAGPGAHSRGNRKQQVPFPESNMSPMKARSVDAGGAAASLFPTPSEGGMWIPAPVSCSGWAGTLKSCALGRTGDCRRRPAPHMLHTSKPKGSVTRLGPTARRWSALPTPRRSPRPAGPLEAQTAPHDLQIPHKTHGNYFQRVLWPQSLGWPRPPIQEGNISPPRTRHWEFTDGNETVHCSMLP